MYTLVVIDMQDFFNVKPTSRVAVNVIREITNARKQSADILFVEFDGYGETLEEIKLAAKDYDRQFTINKFSDDGSSAINAEIYRESLKKTHIRIVGVNTDCCVYRTVAGLASRLPDSVIEVVADACDSDFNHLDGLAAIRRLQHRVCIK